MERRERELEGRKGDEGFGARRVVVRKCERVWR
jgi:hypothetical protein